MHKQIEDYLEQVAAHLTVLSMARRHEELTELRLHLESAVSAFQKSGQSEEKAVQAAIDQFGQPSAVAPGIVSAWRRGKALEKRNFWQTTIGVLALIYLTNKMTSTICVWMWPYYYGHAVDFPVQHPPLFLVAAKWVLWLLVPILAGSLSGGLSTKRARSGAALASVIWYVAVSAWTIPVFNNMLSRNAVQNQDFLSWLYQTPYFHFLCINVTLTTVSAGFAYWLRGRQARKMHMAV